MSDTKLSDRNAAIQAMLTDGENLMNFYRLACVFAFRLLAV